jgi:hypothetical protein
MYNDLNIPSQVPTQVPPSDSSSSLDQHAAEIRRLRTRAAFDIIQIGRRLTLCKADAALGGHGHWLEWLDREFASTEQTELNFMRVNELDKYKNILHLHLPAPKAALSTLAWSDSTVEQRRHFLDGAGLASVKQAMPPTWRADELIRISDGRTTVEKARAVKAPAKRKIKKPPIDLPGDPIQEECTDCDTPEQFWQHSLSNLAGDAVSMRAFWTRQFGKWEKFAVPSELVTLAKQAADAWSTLAKTLASDAEAGRSASHTPKTKTTERTNR